MDNQRKKAVRSVFTVKEKTFITPHYIRIVFHMSDEQIELFRNVKIGANNKIFIPAPGTHHIIFPDEANTGADHLSVKRTYTTRRIDYSKKELWIEFVAHGDNGPASYWAQRAAAGSVLGIAMKESNRPLFPDVSKYVFVGDSTAIPVIAAMLEQLPDGVRANVIIEVFGKEDEMDLSSKANLNVEWTHNPHSEKGSNLAGIVREKVLPDGKRFVFVAAEYATAKNLKSYFKEELSWPSDEYSIVSYWKREESEDQSAMKRQQERSS